MKTLLGSRRTLTTLPYEDRVEAGMAWLDANRPGWEGRIDLGILDLQNSHCCVLGQATVGFWETLTVENDGAAQAVDWAIRCGFYVTNEYGFVAPPAEWSAITETWLIKIKERYNSGQLSG